MSCIKCLRWIFCIKLPVKEQEDEKIYHRYDHRDYQDQDVSEIEKHKPIEISGELKGEPTAMTLGGLASTSIFQKISEWSLPVKKEPRNLFNMSREEISFFEDDHVIDEFINN